ncbi:hypothetical protein CO251_14775 [Sulfobacillus sp. hq2]|nr:hypothetical protein CO251_14775 [Sulfobacillus sp. hq2]
MSHSKKAILVLLGAGSSYSIVPQTAEITNDLLTWIAPSDGSTIINEPFFAPFMKMSQREKKSPNFEDLIDFLDLLASLNWTANGAFDFYPTLWLISRSFRRRSFRRGTIPQLTLNGGFLRLLAHEARTRILSLIYQSSNPMKMSTSAINTVLRTLNQYFQLTVASLNYDNMLDFSGIPLETGFRLPYHQGIYQFDPTIEFSGDNTTLYLPLHGSIHFIPSYALNRSLPSNPTQPLWVEDIDIAENLRHKSGASYSSNKDWQLEPVMITGRNKLANTITYPYSAYLSLFRQHAFNDDVWLLIGYGGCDIHINAILGQALTTRIGIRKPPIIIVCDIGTETDLGKLMRRIWIPFLSMRIGNEVDNWRTLSLITLQHMGWAWLQGIDGLSKSLLSLLGRVPI